jgi:hypothetical protein
MSALACFSGGPGSRELGRPAFAPRLQRLGIVGPVRGRDAGQKRPFKSTRRVPFDSESYTRRMETATQAIREADPEACRGSGEAGRAGGLASGAARRAKREAQPRHWGDVLIDELQSDPQRVVRAVLRSRNGAAIAWVLQIAPDLEAGKLQRLRTSSSGRGTSTIWRAGCRTRSRGRRDGGTRCPLRRSSTGSSATSCAWRSTGWRASTAWSWSRTMEAAMRCGADPGR